MNTLCDVPLKKPFKICSMEHCLCQKRLMQIGCVLECEYEVLFRISGVTIITDGSIKVAIDNDTAKQVLVI